MDFTQFEAGPTCDRDPGVARRRGGQDREPRARRPRPPAASGQPDDDPWYFHQFNANKKSMTLNLKSPRGLEIVRDLLKKADVMVENMAPGTIERLGLCYDEVKKINPGIIYCQVKGFGTGSPYEKSLAFDMIAQAAGGTDQRHRRRRRRTAGQARHQLWRYGYRHADGDQHPRRALQAGQDRPGPPPAGRDAGRDDPLHARAVLAHPAQRPAGAARRQQPVAAGRARAVGALPVQAGRAQRLRLCLLQPRQCRPLAAPAQGHRPRGSEGRRALRNRAGAQPARRRKSTR